MRIYRERVTIFLSRQRWCAVFPWLRARENHHRFGRAGRLLLWEPGWLAVSADGHRWIEDNKAAARLHGWLGPVGTWNDYERAVKSIKATKVNLGKSRKNQAE